MVPVTELHFELDAADERRRWMEDEAVRAWLEIVAEACSAVGIGAGCGDLLGAAVELDCDVRSGFARGGIQDVGRERGHERNLRA